jgi:hypothetical protein
MVYMRNVLQAGCQSDDNAKEDFEFSQCLVVRPDQCGVPPRVEEQLIAARSCWTPRKKQGNRGGEWGTVQREWVLRADRIVFDKASGF